MLGINFVDPLTCQATKSRVINMSDAKLVQTPLLISFFLSLHYGAPLSDPTKYSIVVGSLQIFPTYPP